MNKEATALPGWIIGLMAIPIALSLQRVAEVALYQPNRQCEGFIYFVLIILLYGLHSVALYMIFEVGRRLTRHLPDPQRRVAWRRYLVLRISASGPATVFMVGTLLAVGITFQDPSVQFLSRSLSPSILTLVSFLGPVSSYALTLSAGRLSVLIHEYPVILPYYTLALTTAFVVTCALLL